MEIDNQLVEKDDIDNLGPNTSANRCFTPFRNFNGSSAMNTHLMRPDSTQESPAPHPPEQLYRINPCRSRKTLSHEVPNIKQESISHVSASMFAADEAARLGQLRE
ncbi:MAG: hypothetical protein Q9174_006246 [Haloplaca sp. 1 TL-2023]